MAPRGQLVEDILDQLPLMTGDVEELTGATASFVNLNRTDFRALQALSSSRGMTAGELARALRVTTGATTRVVDSLVAAGHAHREWDPQDRRRILVTVTPAAQRVLERSLQGLREDLRKALAGYSEVELNAVLRFVGSLRGLARTHARRLARPLT
ncbi:MAG: MarR family transcriptional regulator [Candidatus Dormibacteraeota bacterium]|uniref:MarR family transcriptional regulator n=1 Tax=Candidatus Nephthysia bennettiae TaxID=3127016 RepID=A0A934NCB9_9BACT|nr:MarR family transcriptional regulator [Candidatus Dormibacteraeota bacterium]MBJ7613157.1 MarR family transcriptional regulator [Candidatus Dormibacteraeota bacterium]